jgi:hypothetical protein
MKYFTAILQVPDENAWRKPSRSIRTFTALTDSHGLARIPELRSGTELFTVTHDQYEMPIDTDGRNRIQQIKLIAAQTNSTAAKLQKKGKQLLE